MLSKSQTRDRRPSLLGRRISERLETFALDLEAILPSVSNIPTALTIGGITREPTFRYNPIDATETTWPAEGGYGETLEIKGSGTAPTLNDGTPLMGARDSSMKFNGLGGETDSGRQWRSPNASYGQLGTMDQVIFGVVRVPPPTPVVAIAHQLSDSLSKGWLLYSTGSGLSYQLRVGGITTHGTSAIVAAGSIVSFMFFIDRSGYAASYINGVQQGTPTLISARSASVTNPTAFHVGGFTESGITGYYSLSTHIYFLSIWQGEAWLDTHLQPSLAAEMHARLVGNYPSCALGSSVPTAATRASAAYLDKVESDGSRKLYYVGANWIRTVSRPDAGGTTRRGILIEPSDQNTVLYSDGFSASGWVPYNCSIDTGDVSCPDGVVRNANRIDEGTSNDWHRVSATLAALTAGVVYTCGAFVRSPTGGRDKAIIRVYDGAVNRMSTFDLSAGAVGAAMNIIGARIEPWGNGWYRCEITFTASGGTSVCYVEPAVADTTTGSTYVGDGRVALEAFGMMRHPGTYLSSYIPTTSSAVTRSADALRYSAARNWPDAGGVVECGVLMPDVNQAGQPAVIEISDGSANNRLTVAAKTAGDDFATLDVVSDGSAQASVAASSDLWNGALRMVAATVRPNNARIAIDGVVEGSPDTTVTLPVSPSQIDIGGLRSAGSELGGLIRRVRIFKR